MLVCFLMSERNESVSLHDSVMQLCQNVPLNDTVVCQISNTLGHMAKAKDFVKFLKNRSMFKG